jgi:hypothetical protein
MEAFAIKLQLLTRHSLVPKCDYVKEQKTLPLVGLAVHEALLCLPVTVPVSSQHPQCSLALPILDQSTAESLQLSHAAEAVFPGHFSVQLKHPANS